MAKCRIASAAPLIDLVLCDLYMPNVNGVEAVTCLRSHEKALKNR